jgi:Asp-tRNA(Asn)/Glu-tRNA(Gln) amidotransferase A subunit family amidase
MNGLVGFKPPWGRIPEVWPWNREPYAASGPLGRTVRDVALFENAISGPLVGDLYSLSPLELPAAYPPVRGMRIALSPDLGYFNPSREIVEALERAATTLNDLGAVVDIVDLGWTDRALETADTHYEFLMSTILRGYAPGATRHHQPPNVREYPARLPLSVEAWMESWQYGDEMYAELQRAVFLAGYDALICPTVETTTTPADLGYPGVGETATVSEMIGGALTYPFNILGKLPVVNMPIGIAPGNGVPIGMQIVGPPNADAVPFRIASGLEAANGPLFEQRRPTFSQG